MVVTRSQFVQGLLPVALALGLGVSLAQLGTVTFGRQPLVLVAFAALLVAFHLANGIRPTIHRIGAFGLQMLAGLAVISLTSSIPVNTASGLVWGSLILAAFVTASVVMMAISGSQSASQSDEELVPQRNDAAGFLPNTAIVSDSGEALKNQKPDLEFVQGCDEVSEKQTPQIAIFSELQSEIYDEEFDLEEEEFEDDESGNGRVVHSLTRIRQNEEERLEGTMTVEFEAGQKHVYLHVPFSPGFTTRPSAMCLCECDDMFAAEFDILQTYGGRLSVRRRGDFSYPAELSVSIVITAPFSVRRVA